MNTYPGHAAARQRMTPEIDYINAQIQHLTRGVAASRCEFAPTAALLAIAVDQIADIHTTECGAGCRTCDAIRVALTTITAHQRLHDYDVRLIPTGHDGSEHTP